MPKGRMQTAERPKPIPVHRKFKIGGRKSTRGAMQLSIADLNEILEGRGRPKDKDKVRKALYQHKKRESRLLTVVTETLEDLREVTS